MAVSQSIIEQVYVQQESTWGQIPNSSGTATVAGGDAMRHTKCDITAEQQEIPDKDKTGSISYTRGSSGARGARYSLTWEARPNGAAGVEPDFDPLLVAAFGQAGTVVASTSVTYSLANVIKSFTLYRFRQSSSVMQQAVAGAVIQELDFSFALDANCTFTASGTGLWVPDSKGFSALDSTGKAGLSAFPADPGSPTTNGNPVNGLSGSATIDGNTDIQITAASLKIAPGIQIPRDRLFSGRYGSSPERDRITATLDLTIIDEDIASITSLYQKAQAGTAVDITLIAGSGAGTSITWTLSNCLLPQPGLNDSARKWASDLRGIQAFPTSTTSLDEITLAFT